MAQLDPLLKVTSSAPDLKNELRPPSSGGAIVNDNITNMTLPHRRKKKRKRISTQQEVPFPDDPFDMALMRAAEAPSLMSLTASNNGKMDSKHQTKLV